MKSENRSRMIPAQRRWMQDSESNVLPVQRRVQMQGKLSPMFELPGVDEEATARPLPAGWREMPVPESIWIEETPEVTRAILRALRPDT